MKDKVIISDEENGLDKELISELITEENMEEALTLQNSIFPRENARKNYLESIESRKNSNVLEKYQGNYFLVRDGHKKPVGLWGHYLEDNKNEVWLGWFGVSPAETKKGYGTAIFKIFENYAIKNGFSTIRLYTDEKDNHLACKLYEKMGMTKELYKNKNDKTSDIGQILIYSKSLTNKRVKLWKSKFINYKGQKEKEKF